MFTKDILAERIISLRKKSSLSQQQVADAIGVSRATYSDMERTKRDITASEVKMLADLFEISLDMLFVGSQESQHSQPVITDEVEFQADKLRTVLLYMLERCGGKPNLGETVLYKLLYFIDFDHYEQYGKSVTGLTYVHQQFGPVPLQAQYHPVVQEMKMDDALKVFSQEYFGKRQKRYVALRKHALGILNEEEKETIDQVINRLSDMSATKIAQYVHLDIPWKATKSREIIPYQLAFEREAPFSRADHHMDFAIAAAEDMSKALGEMDEDEYLYYENL